VNERKREWERERESGTEKETFEEELHRCGFGFATMRAVLADF